jgi:hypothetical protein
MTPDALDYLADQLVSAVLDVLIAAGARPNEPLDTPAPRA